MLHITCFGAAGLVTGSNYLIETSRGKPLIVDCGLFQGGKEIERLNWQKWGFDPKQIKHLILTHAHIDHSGRIPKIVRDGFRGKILTSPPTAELCRIMLLDSAHVQEMEAEWQTRKNRRKARQETQPLYTTRDAEESLYYLNPVELDQTMELEPGTRLRMRNAGHVLGSCIVELWIEDSGKETKIVFSGDLGKQDQLIVGDPFPVIDADYLFIESTYGNRFHRSLDESKAELLSAIQYAVSHNEKVIIPAFALERTQELLYILGEFSREGRLPDIPVYLDSPLAIKATEIFRKNKKYFDEAARAIVDRGFDPFSLPNLKFTRTTGESIKINQLPGSAIIIAGNGMCTAGRIKHHLKHNLWRNGASIIIVGFQAQGTTGRLIVDGAKNVTIFGEKVAVKAKVFTIGGLSAHADQADLLSWIGHFTEKSRPRVFVVHGEPASSQALARAVRERFNLDVVVPRRGEPLTLAPHEIPRTLADGGLPDTKQDALALASDLEKSAARLRQQIAETGSKISERDMEAIKAIRDQLEGLVS
ncbi:MAG TPA: MBL fold metallo-hydrolase [Desulfomonilaceae bacterium]|nr:MBL fold metallo-hydrolase [Desulfomonilaceae bacterium]